MNRQQIIERIRKHAIEADALVADFDAAADNSNPQLAALRSIEARKLACDALLCLLRLDDESVSDRDDSMFVIIDDDDDEPMTGKSKFRGSDAWDGIAEVVPYRKRHHAQDCIEELGLRDCRVITFDEARALVNAAEIDDLLPPVAPGG